MLLVKIAYFTLIFLQLKQNNCGVLPYHADDFMKYQIERYNSDMHDMRFIQNFLDKMYARANWIPQDEALRMLKLIMKKISTSTSSRQDEYWLLRQG